MIPARPAVLVLAVLALAGCASSSEPTRSQASPFESSAIAACAAAFAAAGATSEPVVIAHSSLVADEALGAASKAGTMSQEQTAALHHLDRMLAATAKASSGDTTATGRIFTRLLEVFNGAGRMTIEQFTLTTSGTPGECLVGFEPGAPDPILPAVIAASS